MEERIARDDVLRFLAEHGGSAKTDEVRSEVGDSELADTAIDFLTEGGLVEGGEGKVKLTETGWREGREALRRHEQLEEILGGHSMAHALEHLELKPEQMMRIASIGRLTPLSELREGEEAVVVFPKTNNPRMLARLFGIGLVPGARLIVMSRKLGSVIVVVRNVLAAVDRDTAGLVMVAKA